MPGRNPLDEMLAGLRAAYAGSLPAATRQAMALCEARLDAAGLIGHADDVDLPR